MNQYKDKIANKMELNETMIKIHIWYVSNSDNVRVILMQQIVLPLAVVTNSKLLGTNDDVSLTDIIISKVSAIPFSRLLIIFRPYFIRWIV